MQATNTRPRFEPTADANGICSHAGVVLLAELADRLGLTAELGRRANCGLVRPGGRHAYDRGAVLRDLAVMLADGGECVSDPAVLRDQAGLFGRVCSTPTAWRILHQIAADPRGVAGLWSGLARARQRAWAAGAAPQGPLRIDVDATLVEAHCDKQLPRRLPAQLRGRLQSRRSSLDGRRSGDGNAVGKGERVRVGTASRPTVTPTPGDKRARRWRRCRGLVVAGGCYLAVSAAVQHATLRHPFSTTTGSPAVDAHLFVWWLRWTPLALGHGHNPLLTDYMNYPDGVNGMWNTGVVTLGILAAPLTLAFGPIFSFDTLMLLGPVAAGLAFFVVVRRYVGRGWVAALGGAAYAFSPFAVAHLAIAHLHLVWAVLPPLLLLFLDELLVRQRVHAWLLGIALGVVLLIQAGLYSQTLALGGLLFVVAAVAVAARWPGEVGGRVRYVAVAGCTAAGTFGVLYGYPLWLLWRGPGVPRAPFRGTGHWVGDLASLVVPPRLMLLGGWAAHIGAYRGDPRLYLGLVVMAVALLTVVLVRRPIVRLTAIVGAVAMVLSLGSRLAVFGSELGIWLPGAALRRLPLLVNVEPERLAGFTWLCVALLLALWLDAAAAAPRLPVRVTGLALGALALASAAPRPVAASPVEIPAFFRDGSVSRLLPQGAVVKTVPRATAAHDGGALPLAWQATSGLRYRTTGGYFIGADRTHAALLQGVPDAYDQVSGAVRRGARPPGPNAPATLAARAVLRERKVALLLVVPQPQDGDHLQALLAWTRTVTGRPGRYQGGVWVFNLR